MPSFEGLVIATGTIGMFGVGKSSSAVWSALWTPVELDSLAVASVADLLSYALGGVPSGDWMCI